ncbi:kinase-like protein [Martensiomyces pterosporus]|nr:kinase-like protein [Martensiomyces pterosporus]
MTNSQLSVEHVSRESLIDNVPYIAFEVRHDSLFEDSKELLVKAFPDWRDDELTLKQCKDGITNKLIQCTNKQTGLTVLIRAYGKHTEVIIDRDQELINMAGLAYMGMCPPLYARFDNGLLYGFIPGNIVKPEEMGSETLGPLIAKKLSEWNRILLPGDRSPQLFPVIRRWLGDVPRDYEDKAANEKFHAHFSLEKLARELDELEEVLVKLDSPVVFSHNDLLSGNVILSSSQEDVSFIDYEYAAYSYRGFDIANHFNEYAGFECDYSRYPAKESQLAWFKIYLENADQDASPEVLEKMYEEVSLFQLASHYYWGVWALVQASISDIDFDYMDYAKSRFDQYFKVKAELLN